MTPADLVVERLLHREGGVADLGDGAGLTSYGQTAAWLERWGLERPTDAMAAADNYHRWLERSRIGAFVERDHELGDLVADYAIHSGEQRAITTLQQRLGVTPDGIIGPITLTAFEDAPRRRLQHQLLADRLRYLGALLGSQTTDRRRWAKGWLRRVADQIEAAG